MTKDIARIIQPLAYSIAREQFATCNTPKAKKNTNTERSGIAMIRAGKLPAAIYGILSGGVQFNVENVILQNVDGVSVVNTLTADQLAVVRGVVNKLYFRECNLNRNRTKYAKYEGKAPYHQSANLNAANNENGFPSQCRNGLLGFRYSEDKNDDYFNELKKDENFIAEVYAQSTALQQGGGPEWFRVGIVHLHRLLRVVELNVICTDTFTQADKSLFSHVMDFALKFARGTPTPQSTDQNESILVRYSLTKPYQNGKARQKWERTGSYVTLEATTLASMTKYMHKGFRFAPLTAGNLFDVDAKKVGCNTYDKDTAIGTVREYFDLCLGAGQGRIEEFNPDFFTKELWGAMRALAQFTSDDATKQTIKKVQDAVPLGGDELTEGAVRGAPHERFTYALLALLTALTLLYADPQYVMNGGRAVGNADELPELEVQAKDRANDMAALFKDIETANTDDQKTALIRRMLDIAGQLKTGSAIPMVKHNVAAAQ